MHHIAFKAVSPIPPLIALLLSEAINHLRAAIDNALLIKLEAFCSEPLTDSQIKNVAFPIRSDASKLAEWTKKACGKGPKEQTDGPLADSILKLQPVNDKGSAAPPIFSERMA